MKYLATQNIINGKDKDDSLKILLPVTISPPKIGWPINIIEVSSRKIVSLVNTLLLSNLLKLKKIIKGKNINNGYRVKINKLAPFFLEISLKIPRKCELLNFEPVKIFANLLKR